LIARPSERKLNIKQPTSIEAEAVIQSKKRRHSPAMVEVKDTMLEG
jgi:hypothetical protein